MRIKYCGDSPFKTMLIFVSSMTVKTSWVGGIPIFSCQYSLAYVLGFTVTL